MLVLAAIVGLHITTIILLLVATIDNAWWWITDTVSTDLWGKWTLKDSVWHYSSLSTGYTGNYLQVVQGTSILATVFTILALFVFVAQLFTLPKGQRFICTGILQLIACLCIMTAASVYTAQFHIGETGAYGHSYILAWISFVLTVVLTVTYLILRKKTE
ncbi:epithelial membrane protein 1 [Kryptolebias marmoratus]|uniref:epithelial membrane protein 1 n=1 Tax=Kryptolebias marmoratus TaxID=37003 RepID=UPI0007F92BC8|nr:epithelial membrane protein 1 [Kryptolebias marmoratus]XP_024863706.1 epithelial membrane protein 1 [Kryptolebias marmoratus]XP_037830713.1 epithelial membrane protein 1 [Kryptolebias marmoratus]